MSPNLYVTNTHKINPESVAMAESCSKVLKVPFIPRNKRPLNALCPEGEEAGFLVVSKNLELSLIYKGFELFFHPSMSKVRIKALQKGQNDPMLTAMDACPGDSVLDCTLGLGSDAIVASFAVGASGRVVGLESVPVIALIVRHGLQHYRDKNERINEAMRRIEVINADYLNYLKTLPDNSFDIVYFDPMFRKPMQKSSSMKPLRRWVNGDPLSMEAVNEAVRVATKRVVMKEGSSSGEFARLGFKNIVGGKHSPIAFGFIITGKGEKAAL
ncbi:hypothetical protein Tfer_0517 [Thermincola ferriacetica]|uniref:SAM-dependent methyltransferase n=1 Tax=Thermincola ferriacetica TaxID=281456 RepID=A0A0L6W5H8_9FIRM|nr:class I SAM-dependent methyltransferase [Thermincola ferriacetica]KNZ70837.1 hypothetical protein Tfer_0517 [Thermincola ferriacetica]